MSKSQASNFIKKETLTQVFSCEFGKISKNAFLFRTPLVAASELLRTPFLQNTSEQILSVVSMGMGMHTGSTF